MYSYGLILAAALILNQNPFFEIASSYWLIVIRFGGCRTSPNARLHLKIEDSSCTFAERMLLFPNYLFETIYSSAIERLPLEISAMQSQ